MRIYSAYTPYHLLLVTALQIGAGDPPAIVIYRDECEFLVHLGSIGKTLPNVLFESYVAEEKPTRWATILASQWSARRRAKSILRHIKCSSVPPELYVCSPCQSDVLRATYKVRRAVQIHFVEDGLDAYFSDYIRTYERRSLIHHYGWRILNGYPTPRVLDNTRMMNFSKFHLLFPEIGRSTIPPDRTERIEPVWFNEAVRRLGKLIVGFMPVVTPTHMIFATLSTNMENVSSYISWLERWATETRSVSSENICAIKLHPRECNTELLRALASMEIIQYPAWIPAELVVSQLDPACRIITGLSTFILSSKVLAPDRIISLDSSVSEIYYEAFQEWDSSITIHHT